ncbi:MAG: sensor histidine kinase, partial [Gemmatimonadaceae bacterium]
QPHFLFNALNAIASAVYDDPAAADAMIGHLGELLRHALRTSTQPEIALADELGVLRSYLEIVHARFGVRVSFDLDVGPDTEALAVPALLLQPLVENAVRHGSVMEYASTIKIRIARMRDDLHITVENEMPPTETTGRTPGTGLSTTRDRLRLMYGEAHSFEARGIGSRFIVNIRLPMRSVPLLTQMEPAQVHAGADR